MLEIQLKGTLSPKDLKVIAKEVAIINENKGKEAKETKVNKPEKLFTVKEVAEMTSRTPWTVRMHISAKILKATKVGKSWLITEKEYNNYIQKDNE